MARATLEFEYGGRDYALAYDAEVLKALDKSGQLAAIANGERPITMLEDLFLAAFETNHRAVPNRTRREILAEFTETSEDGTLLECLFEMLNEAREALAPRGNIKWKMSR